MTAGGAAPARGDSFCQEPDQQVHEGRALIRVAEDLTPLRAAERFSFPSEETLDGIRWWGAYIPIPSVLDDCNFADDFKVRFYEDEGGLPSETPLATYVLGALVFERATGVVVYDPLYPDRSNPEFVYYARLDPPFVAAAGHAYWVEVANRGVDEPNLCFWYWETAPPGDGFSVWDAAINGWDAADVRAWDLAVCLPAGADLDCNSNGIIDDCDLDCGVPGGPCDVPGCGQSDDRDIDGVPDECESQPSIPVLSGPGTGVLGLTLLAAAIPVLRRRVDAIRNHR